MGEEAAAACEDEEEERGGRLSMAGAITRHCRLARSRSDCHAAPSCLSGMYLSIVIPSDHGTKTDAYCGAASSSFARAMKPCCGRCQKVTVGRPEMTSRYAEPASKLNCLTYAVNAVPMPWLWCALATESSSSSSTLGGALGPARGGRRRSCSYRRA